jgi:TolB-like protein
MGRPAAAPTPRRPNKYFGTLAAALLAGLAIAAGVLVFRTDRAAFEIRSLVVMPFASFDPSSRQLHLELGMANALAARLAGVETLRVPPAVAVRAGEDPIAAGRRLAVDAVLTGSVEHRDDRLRLKAALVRVRDGRALWSAEFDDPFTSIFEVEDTIAERIAAGVVSNLTEKNRASLRRRETQSPEAYEIYLKGRERWARRTPDSIRTAIALYQEAIKLDARFALAHAGLAESYAVTASGLSAVVRFPLAKTAAATAIALDDRLAEAHNVLGFLAYKADWNWDLAERQFTRAIELDASFPLARHWFAEMLGLIGRSDESAAQFERAQALDPLSAAIRADFARMWTRAGKPEEALRLAGDGLVIDPNEFRLHRERGLALVRLGRDAEAYDSFLRYRALVGTSVDDLTALRDAHARGGLRGYRLREIEMLRRQLQAGGTWPFGLATALATAYGAVGDRVETLQWLERCLNQKEDGALGMKVNREFDFLRDDPSFQSLMRRVGFL